MLYKSYPPVTKRGKANSPMKSEISQPCLTSRGFSVPQKSQNVAIPLDFWDYLTRHFTHPVWVPKAFRPVFPCVGRPKLQHADALLETAAPPREVTENDGTLGT